MTDQTTPAYDAGDAAPATPWTVTIGGVDIPAALDQARAELASARQEITALHHLADERTRERDLWRDRCDAHAWDRITRERDRLDRELTEAMAILARIGDTLSPTGERPEEALPTLAADVQAYVERADAERERIRSLLIRPLLDARRCIPDGQITKGCLRFDGARVRETLRVAWLDAFGSAGDAQPSSVPDPRAQGDSAETVVEAALTNAWPGEPFGHDQVHAEQVAAVAVRALRAAGRLAGDTTPPDAPLARIDADGEIWYPQPDGRWLYSGDINVVATLPELEADSGPTRLVRLVPVPAEPTSPADQETP
jgi:hypothetical protein